jgi:two-component system chemotaxis response regulator CheY
MHRLHLGRGSYPDDSSAAAVMTAATVFIVDDNEVIRRALRGLIRHDERLIVVGEAASGEMALEGISALKPDLVCLDILLPGIDGLAVLRTIREEHPTVRVVMITGQATSETVSKARELGAHGFVVKPFNGAKVLATIHAALGRTA